DGYNVEMGHEIADGEIARDRAARERCRRDVVCDCAPVAHREDIYEEGGDVERRDATDYAVPVVVIGAAGCISQITQERAQRPIGAEGDCIYREVLLLELG